MRVSRFRKPAEHEITFTKVESIPSFAEWKDVGRMLPDKRLKFEILVIISHLAFFRNVLTVA